MSRYFNTSGPSLPEKHYTLMRRELIERGKRVVKGPIVFYDEEKDF